MANENGSRNGRRPMILSPHGGQAHASPDDAPMTRAQVKELMVEIVGSFAHTVMGLERQLAALEAHLGVTYHPPQGANDGNPAADDGGLSADQEKAVPESRGGRTPPEASQAEPE